MTKIEEYLGGVFDLFDLNIEQINSAMIIKLYKDKYKISDDHLKIIMWHLFDDSLEREGLYKLLKEAEEEI